MNWSGSLIECLIVWYNSLLIINKRQHCYFHLLVFANSKSIGTINYFHCPNLCNSFLPRVPVVSVASIVYYTNWTHSLLPLITSACIIQTERSWRSFWPRIEMIPMLWTLTAGSTARSFNIAGNKSCSTGLQRFVTPEWKLLVPLLFQYNQKIESPLEHICVGYSLLQTATFLIYPQVAQKQAAADPKALVIPQPIVLLYYCISSTYRFWRRLNNCN